MYSHCICSPKTGIMLFVNQRGYVRLEPPVIICTIIVIVDIAARQQRFQAASLLPRKMSANNNMGGGEPTRRSASPSPLPPDCDNDPVPSSFGVAPPMATAIVGGCHLSLVIVPLLQSVAVIILVLLLPPKRTPIPDHDSCPRRATYDNDSGLGSIHVRGLSLSWAQRQGGPSSIHPLPPLSPRQHRRPDLHHVRCLLEVKCVRMSVLPSFYALFNFSPSGL